MTPPDPTPPADLAAKLLAVPKSIILTNAEKDPDYRPYCGRCPRLVRMQKVAPFLWECRCGAAHDERPYVLADEAARVVKELEQARAECARLRADMEAAIALTGAVCCPPGEDAGCGCRTLSLAECVAVMRDRLREEAGRLRAALERYGGHGELCASYFSRPPKDIKPCDCGLDALLADTPPGPSAPGREGEG